MRQQYANDWGAPQQEGHGRRGKIIRDRRCSSSIPPSTWTGVSSLQRPGVEGDDLRGRGGVLRTSYHGLSNRGAHPDGATRARTATGPTRGAPAPSCRGARASGPRGRRSRGGQDALVDEFCPGPAGTAVLRTSCDALSTPGPLGPVRDLAPALGLQIEQLAALDGDAREQLFRDVLAAFAARPGPTVVIGEDAHWADGASLELLRFLGRRIGGLRTLFVVTYRDDEIGADHPLRLVLGDLATAPTVHRLSLRPLSEEAVSRLAAGQRARRSALYRLTGGNPFFLTEVLATGGETVPATVGDAVLARAARLSPEARAVLDVAAVIGSTIDTGPPARRRRSGPRRGRRVHCPWLVAGELMTGLAFRHELTREAILAAIAPLRRRLLHARVLAALRDAPEAERDLARLAHHAEAAGDREAVLEFAIAAAEQAAALHAHREAAAQYARALRFADALPAARARPPAGGTIGRLLLERSWRGGDRGAPGGPRHLAHVG